MSETNSNQEYQEHDQFPRVEAIKSTISGMNWLIGEIVELYLHPQPSSSFKTPLNPVSEGHRDDEVPIGDIAMPLGPYAVIGER